MGKNGDAAKLLPLPTGAVSGYLTLSRDGTRGLLNANFAVAPFERQYVWTPAQGFVGLGEPAGQTCEVQAHSDDISVVAGTCSGGTHTQFRWSEAGLAPLAQDLWPDLLSRDGKILWGEQRDDAVAPHKLFVLTGAGPASIFQLPNNRSYSQMLVASDDASVAYLNAYSDNNNGGPTAARWTDDGQLSALADLPGLSLSHVDGFNADGKLAVGHGASRVEDLYFGTPVLWDEQGARDILGELAAAHIDIADIKSMQPERVWSDGATLRIQGTCQHGDVYQIFFAELPKR